MTSEHTTAPRPLRAVLLAGHGRYADPWHPFDETVPALASALEAEGLVVEIRRDVDDALASFEDPDAVPDLLVVDVGLPRDDAPSPADSAAAGFEAVLTSGCPLLGVHVSATSFTGSPAWERALGGRWVRGESMHPDRGVARVRVLEHPLVSGLGDFTLVDERYSFLRTSPAVEVLAVHEHDGVDHPLAWLRPADGIHGPAAYDALGHDAESFDSPEHRELLARLIRHLIGADAPGAPAG